MLIGVGSLLISQSQVIKITWTILMNLDVKGNGNLDWEPITRTVNNLTSKWYLGIFNYKLVN